jgi:hypothetical protein
MLAYPDISTTQSRTRSTATRHVIARTGRGQECGQLILPGGQISDRSVQPACKTFFASTPRKINKYLCAKNLIC